VSDLPRNKNPEETIQKILDASLKLFCEKGYDETTILDIVEEMQASRGAFYHHFKSKKEVLYALMERNYNIEEYQKVCDDPELSGLEKIRHLIIHPLDESHSEEVQLTQIMLDLLKEPQVLAEHVKDLRGEGVVELQKLVEQGMEDGSIEPQDPQTLTELMLLLLNFWLLPTIYPVADQVYEEKILMIKRVLDGVGCPLIDGKSLVVLRGLADKYTE